MGCLIYADRESLALDECNRFGQLVAELDETSGIEVPSRKIILRTVPPGEQLLLGNDVDILCVPYLDARRLVFLVVVVFLAALVLVLILLVFFILLLG